MFSDAEFYELSENVLLLVQSRLGAENGPVETSGRPAKPGTYAKFTIVQYSTVQYSTVQYSTVTLSYTHLTLPTKA